MGLCSLFTDLKLTRYQLIMLYGFYALTYPMFAANQLFSIFANAEPKWECGNSGHITNNCTVYNDCNNISMVTDYFSIPAQLDLVCGDAHTNAMISTLQMVGLIVGNIIFGQVSDSFGRKPTVLVSATGIAVLSTSSTFATQWQAIAALRFLTGLFIGGYVVGANTLIMECLDTANQRLFTRSLANTWGESRIIYGAVAYWTRDWRTTFQAINLVSLPIVLFVVGFCIVESQRWLLQKNKPGQLRKSIEWVAKVNGQAGPVVIPTSVDDGKIHTYKDLFATRELRKRSILCAFIWFSCTLISFGMDLSSGEMPGNRFTNQIIIGAAISIGKPLIFFVDAYFPRFNRRLLHQCSMGAMVLLLAVIAGLTSAEASSAINSALVAVFIIGMPVMEYQWDAVYLYSLELFPTVCRSVGLAFSGIVGRCGNALAPQVVFLARYWEPAPPIVFCVLGSIVIIISIFFLPDTKHSELPDTINLKSVPIDGGASEPLMNE